MLKNKANLFTDIPVEEIRSTKILFMERSIFKNFEKQHCRIKMKSGKEVYGIMWEENMTDNNFKYYFSSSGDYQRLKNRLQSALYAIYQLDLNDIIYAEVISSK